MTRFLSFFRRPRLLPALIASLCLLLAVRVGAMLDAPAEPRARAVADRQAPMAGILAIASATAQERPAAPAAAPPARPTLDEPPSFTPAEIEILQDLAKRRAEIDARARELSEREALLQAAEKQIEKKLQELKEMQAAVESILKRADDQDDARKKSLVKIFEGMKPPEAARIVEQMELPQIVELFERMKERSASPILAQMHPVRARQVAAELAKRRQPAQAGAARAG